jgi:exopolyphosphatase/guanosine-5'-triphosphate,3'-diphosphate pyrophosphatase
MEKQHDSIYAAIDLGTNACRLTIVSARGTSVRILETFSKVVQFGEGLRSTGMLSERAMNKAIEVLLECSERLSKYTLRDSMYVATEACRSASNADIFLARVEKETGIILKIISWREEAYFATIACTSIMSRWYRHGIVFDIGGGSTEISWFRYDGRVQVIDSTSIPLGFMTISDPDDEAIKDKKCQDMRIQVQNFYARNKISNKMVKSDVQLIGVSGTLNSIIGLVLGSNIYNRQLVNRFVLRVPDIDKALEKIFSEHHSSGNVVVKSSQHLLQETIENSGVDSMLTRFKNKSVIISDSALILRELHNVFRMPITIADRGVRDGLIAYMMMKTVENE